MSIEPSKRATDALKSKLEAFGENGASWVGYTRSMRHFVLCLASCWVSEKPT